MTTSPTQYAAAERDSRMAPHRIASPTMANRRAGTPRAFLRHWLFPAGKARLLALLDALR